VFGQKPLRRSHARRRGKPQLHPNAAAALAAPVLTRLVGRTAGPVTCGDFWRFRCGFPTDACDPPLAIVRLRSSFRPNRCGWSERSRT